MLWIGRIGHIPGPARCAADTMTIISLLWRSNKFDGPDTIFVQAGLFVTIVQQGQAVRFMFLFGRWRIRQHVRTKRVRLGPEQMANALPKLVLRTKPRMVQAGRYMQPIVQPHVVHAVQPNVRPNVKGGPFPSMPAATLTTPSTIHTFTKSRCA